MANQDSFIDEVTEEVRRDRLFAIFRRYGWIGIVAVVAIVGGATWNEWRKATLEAEAQLRGDTLLAVLETEDASARADGLARLAETGDASAVTGLFSAATLAAEGNADAARLELDAIAANPALPQVYRDLATLKSVMMTVGTEPPADRIARLEPLTAPGGAFRSIALEQTAIAHAEAGDGEAALAILVPLVGDAGASEGLRRRAAQMIVALGGTLEAS